MSKTLTKKITCDASGGQQTGFKCLPAQPGLKFEVLQAQVSGNATGQVDIYFGPNQLTDASNIFSSGFFTADSGFNAQIEPSIVGPENQGISLDCPAGPVLNIVLTYRLVLAD